MVRKMVPAEIFVENVQATGEKRSTNESQKQKVNLKRAKNNNLGEIAQKEGFRT